ncbi:arsenical resistance protein ArsH, partial [Xanthomonas euvesicatoria]
MDVDALAGPGDPRHPPRILILYGSLRERSYSRLLAEEAGRLLRWYGCDVGGGARSLSLKHNTEPPPPRT